MSLGALLQSARSSIPFLAAPASAAGRTGTNAAETDAADDRLAQARSAVATLKDLNSHRSDDAKARAEQKVRELKDRIAALRLVFAGDRKGLARAVAALARELGAAVKEYAAAGGNAAGLGNVGTAAGPAADAQIGAERGRTAETGTGEPTATQPAAAEPAAQAGTDAYRARITRVKAEERRGDGTRDAEFARDVRALLRKLKAALADAPGDRDDAPLQRADREEAKRVLKGTEHAVGALEQSAPTSPGILVSLSA
ncbi:MAG: hypothetical protein ACOY45_07845 [Pseudomonadota bacterium]